MFADIQLTVLDEGEAGPGDDREKLTSQSLTAVLRSVEKNAPKLGGGD